MHGPGADIDTLLVAPRYATREEDFFGTLVEMLKEIKDVTEMHPVPDAHVPVLKMKFAGWLENVMAVSTSSITYTHNRYNVDVFIYILLVSGRNQYRFIICAACNQLSF